LSAEKIPTLPTNFKIIQNKKSTALWELVKSLKVRKKFGLRANTKRNTWDIYNGKDKMRKKEQISSKNTILREIISSKDQRDRNFKSRKLI